MTNGAGQPAKQPLAYVTLLFHTSERASSVKDLIGDFFAESLCGSAKHLCTRREPLPPRPL